MLTVPILKGQRRDRAGMFEIDELESIFIITKVLKWCFPLS
jgi:hypothetical protein